MQVVKSIQEGANHLGGDETSEGVDPDREFWPAGQGAGAITDIVPAGELVERFVARGRGRPRARCRRPSPSDPSAGRPSGSDPALDLLDHLHGVADGRDVEHAWRRSP